MTQAPSDLTTIRTHTPASPSHHAPHTASREEAEPPTSLPGRLQQHRDAWAAKPALREVYQHYFRDILDQTTNEHPIVELGSGPGFFKEYLPELVTTDVEQTPWADQVVDACALPFPDSSVGNIVMFDVFHHLGRPMQCLEEAARVLRPHGRLVMLEPWTKGLGFLFYRYIHHESASRQVDPQRPFDQGKDALDGNAALPELYFTNRGHQPPLGHLPGRLHIHTVTPVPSWAWLLTAGMRPYTFLPRWLLPMAMGMETLLKPITPRTSLRALITLQRPPTQ